jgi:hypothetical protein
VSARKTGHHDRRRLTRIVGLAVILTIGIGSTAIPAPSATSRGYGYGRPTPAPSGTPVPPSPAVPIARPNPFRFSLRLVKGQTVRSVRRRGLRLRAICSRSCIASARVLIGRTTARKLRIARRAKVIGRRSAVLRAAKRRTLTVRLNKRARRGLTRVRKARIRRLRLTVRGQAIDAAETRVRVTRRPRLKRR